MERLCIRPIVDALSQVCGKLHHPTCRGDLRSLAPPSRVRGPQPDALNSADQALHVPGPEADVGIRAGMLPSCAGGKLQRLMIGGGCRVCLRSATVLPAPTLGMNTPAPETRSKACVASARSSLSTSSAPTTHLAARKSFRARTDGRPAASPAAAESDVHCG